MPDRLVQNKVGTSKAKMKLMKLWRLSLTAVIWGYFHVWFVFFYACDWLFQFQTSQPKPKRTKTQNVTKNGLSIIVLNFNGLSNLQYCLQSVATAAKQFPANIPVEVIFVDNGSTDQSVAFVKAHFPWFRIILIPKNISFAAANNLGVKKAKFHKFILINNDMLVEKTGFRKLYQTIITSDAFAITPQQFFWDPSVRREETGLTRLLLHKGQIQIFHKELQGRSKKLIPIFWAGAGFSIYDRQKYLQLGGLSKLYEPIYWEDVDLSYRAWARGWGSYVLPAVHVRHKHQGTTKKMYQVNYLSCLKATNQKKFFCANLLNWPSLYKILAGFFRLSAYYFVKKNDFTELKSILKLTWNTHKILQARKKLKHYVVSSDQIIFWHANGGETRLTPSDV